MKYDIEATLAAITLSDARAYGAAVNQVAFTRAYLHLGSGYGLPDSRVARTRAAFQALIDLDEALPA
jgi:hypothetical protein